MGREREREREDGGKQGKGRGRERDEKREIEGFSLSSFVNHWRRMMVDTNRTWWQTGELERKGELIVLNLIEVAEHVHACICRCAPWVCDVCVCVCVCVCECV